MVFSTEMTAPPIKNVQHRKMVFVTGKGGVGKTVVSKASALALSQMGLRTLWVTFEDPTRPAGEFKKLSATLCHLNCDATMAFEEYISLKIGISTLARIFVQNKLMRYLAQAAPGIHELVLLGKLWHERKNYDHIVIDMPSTGYGLAMFQSIQNWARLFKGGPLHADAEGMLETFRNPAESGYLIVSLPEETPLRESIELSQFLLELFPENPTAFVVNRLFPQNEKIGNTQDENPDLWPTPFAISTYDYAIKRAALEKFNLRLWRDENLPFAELDFIPPPNSDSTEPIIVGLSTQLKDRGFV